MWVTLDQCVDPVWNAIIAHKVLICVLSILELLFLKVIWTKTFLRTRKHLLDSSFILFLLRYVSFTVENFEKKSNKKSSSWSLWNFMLGSRDVRLSFHPWFHPFWLKESLSKYCDRILRREQRILRGTQRNHRGFKTSLKWSELGEIYKLVKYTI